MPSLNMKHLRFWKMVTLSFDENLRNGNNRLLKKAPQSIGTKRRLVSTWIKWSKLDAAMFRVVLAALLLLVPSLAVADITGKPRVIDGDTIEIAGERIRLHGIDAPESKQTCTDADGKEWRCGQDATFALAELIGDHWITCKGDERGKYGRLIAVCYAGPYDLNAKMVRQGWALAYRRYSMDYVDDEKAAKIARKHHRDKPPQIGKKYPLIPI